MSKTIVIILLSFISYYPLATLASDDTTAGTGNELIQFCNQTNYNANNMGWKLCVGYVNGVVDGYIYATDMLESIAKVGSSDPREKNYFDGITLAFIALKGSVCSPKDATRMQFALVVTKFLTDHPEKLTDKSGTLVFDALFNVWSCSKKQ